VACLSGDLASLKRHLASGAATLEDVTSKNWTLMTVSSDDPPSAVPVLGLTTIKGGHPRRKCGHGSIPP
jgi:hypothetical protein